MHVEFEDMMTRLVGADAELKEQVKSAVLRQFMHLDAHHITADTVREFAVREAGYQMSRRQLAA